MHFIDKFPGISTSQPINQLINNPWNIDPASVLLLSLLLINYEINLFKYAHSEQDCQLHGKTACECWALICGANKV